jgi:hypothetical protein
MQISTQYKKAGYYGCLRIDKGTSTSFHIYKKSSHGYSRSVGKRLATGFQQKDKKKGVKGFPGVQEKASQWFPEPYKRAGHSSILKPSATKGMCGVV